MVETLAAARRAAPPSAEVRPAARGGPSL